MPTPMWDLPGASSRPASPSSTRSPGAHEELGVRVDTSSTSHLCRLGVGPTDDPAVLSAWLVRDWQGTPANVAPEEHDGMEWFGLRSCLLPHLLARDALVEAMRGRRG